MMPPAITVGSRSAAFEQVGDQRGGGGLAVGAGDGHGGARAHQLGQHLGAADDGKAALLGRFEFRIAGLHRGGDDEMARAVEVGRVVADQAGDAAGAQALEIGAVLQVAALDGDSRGYASPRRWRSCRCRRCRRYGTGLPDLDREDACLNSTPLRLEPRQLLDKIGELLTASTSPTWPFLRRSSANTSGEDSSRSSSWARRSRLSSGWRTHQPPPTLLQPSCIFKLIVVKGMRQRHQQAGPADRRQLGNGRSARARR